MTGERFASVWDALESTPAQAANLKLRSDMMIALGNHIERAGLTQAQAAKLFGVSQPRISDLKRGKVALFSLDALVTMLAMAGVDVRLEFEPRTEEAVQHMAHA